MLIKSSRIVAIVCLFVLSGCSELSDNIDMQNQYASDLSNTYSPEIFLNKRYTPAVTRGMIETNYSASLPKGTYTPIASSSGRNFYQAPYGFEYMKKGKVESTIGGVVQVFKNNDSAYYVWFFPRQLKYYEVEPNGEWISNVKPGLFHLKNRPWIEKDLKINR